MGGLFAGLLEFIVLYVYFEWLGRARGTIVDMREKISERETSKSLTSSSDSYKSVSYAL